MHVSPLSITGQSVQRAPIRQVSLMIYRIVHRLCICMYLHVFTCRHISMHLCCLCIKGYMYVIGGCVYTTGRSVYLTDVCVSVTDVCYYGACGCDKWQVAACT